ncbi:MAG: DUF2760 domain-containing protein [Lentisphaeria bacterium]|nr:DUF2760 domain-containing protein [Lentisphaeria bacterium]NQZ70113.1 DUF2760 domain-containing protein [Lentisphaeria bacterium]
MSRIGDAFKAFFLVMGGTELVPKGEQEKVDLKDDSEETKIDLEAELKTARLAAFKEGAVYSLQLLQREGRLIDFLQEDIGAYSNEQIGTAVRQIHTDCSAALQENFSVEALREEAEGDTLDIGNELNPNLMQLTGNVPDNGPYKGVLRHKGWVAAKLNLPERHGDIDPTIIKAAELEIQ